MGEHMRRDLIGLEIGGIDGIEREQLSNLILIVEYQLRHKDQGIDDDQIFDNGREGVGPGELKRHRAKLLHGTR